MRLLASPSVSPGKNTGGGGDTNHWGLAERPRGRAESGKKGVLETCFYRVPLSVS